MTRKHFIALARAIAERRAEAADGCPRAFDNLTADIASICATANSNFDRARFTAACGKVA